MSKSKIYTKTGDNGETSLVSGSRIKKSDPRIDLYGQVDELNSRIGFSCSLLKQEKNLTDIVIFLELIQSLLFDLGSNLACEADNRLQYKLPQITALALSQLEHKIDEMDKELTPLKNFILPGGHPTAAHLHLCRTQCRLVERQLVAFKDVEALPSLSVEYINRLSDYFFVLARFMNKKFSFTEPLWQTQS